MKKLFGKLYWSLYVWRENSRYEKDKAVLKKKYPDYDDSEDKMVDDMIQVFGSGGNGLHGMNNLEIIYWRDSKTYTIDIETAYMGSNEDTSDWELPYLREMFNIFKQYMIDNDLNMDVKPFLFMQQPIVSNRAETIEKLYCNFKMFVHGFEKARLDYELNIEMSKG